MTRNKKRQLRKQRRWSAPKWKMYLPGSGNEFKRALLERIARGPAIVLPAAQDIQAGELVAVVGGAAVRAGR